MKDLSKVSSTQIFDICKNVVVCLLTIIVVMVGSQLLPFYFAPIIGLLGAAFLYTKLYNQKFKNVSGSCMLVAYCLFFSLLAYSFISILVNVAYIWGWMDLPDEFIFFNDPYIPSLWMCPIIFLTLLVMNVRRKRLRLCIECRMHNGNHSNRGVFGSIINTESRVQLRNLIGLFGILTIVVWVYYLIEYQSLNTNGKDRYMFFWVPLVMILVDVIYFFYRYYNLFLDLRDNDELLTPEELQDMSAKTYLRYYVICGNKVFLNPDSEDATNPMHRGIDTPFFTHKQMSGLTGSDVMQAIRQMTGGKEGELRFFFGRRNPDIEKHSVIRYFYFLDGNPEDYPEMNAEGGWFDFEEVKLVYNQRPELMATLAVSDLNRLATIVITEKMYKEDGERRIKLKHYSPTFDLLDVRESDLDFQDDKWLRVAVFNSDSPFYRIRKPLYNFITKRRKKLMGKR